MLERGDHPRPDRGTELAPCLATAHRDRDPGRAAHCGVGARRRRRPHRRAFTAGRRRARDRQHHRAALLRAVLAPPGPGTLPPPVDVVVAPRRRRHGRLGVSGWPSGVRSTGRAAGQRRRDGCTRIGRGSVERSHLRSTGSGRRHVGRRLTVVGPTRHARVRTHSPARTTQLARPGKHGPASMARDAWLAVRLGTRRRQPRSCCSRAAADQGDDL